MSHDFIMGSYSGSVGNNFNPASYTRHFLDSPISWRPGSSGGRFPQGSPSAQLFSSLDTQQPPNTSSTEELKPGDVLQQSHLQNQHQSLQHHHHQHHSSFDAADDMELELDLDNPPFPVQNQALSPSSHSSPSSGGANSPPHSYAHYSHATPYHSAQAFPYISDSPSPASSSLSVNSLRSYQTSGHMGQSGIPVGVHFPHAGPGVPAPILTNPEEAFNTYAYARFAADYSSHMPGAQRNASNSDEAIAVVAAGNSLGDYPGFPQAGRPGTGANVGDNGNYNQQQQSPQGIAPALLFASQSDGTATSTSSASATADRQGSTGPSSNALTAQKLKLPMGLTTSASQPATSEFSTTITPYNGLNNFPLLPPPAFVIQDMGSESQFLSHSRTYTHGQSTSPQQKTQQISSGQQQLNGMSMQQQQEIAVQERYRELKRKQSLASQPAQAVQQQHTQQPHGILYQQGYESIPVFEDVSQLFSTVDEATRNPGTDAILHPPRVSPQSMKSDHGHPPYPSLSSLVATSPSETGTVTGSRRIALSPVDISSFDYRNLHPLPSATASKRRIRRKTSHSSATSSAHMDLLRSFPPVTPVVEEDEEEELFHKPRPRTRSLLGPTHDMVAWLKTLFRDKDRYRILLGLKCLPAQTVVDLLQELLDSIHLLQDTTFRKEIIVTLQKLSNNAKVYPLSYLIQEGIAVDRECFKAAGGFGEIYKCEFRGRAICVKMIKLAAISQGPQFMRQFMKEAILWAQLSHPNIVPFQGFCHYSQRPCLVSPWMSNGHINDYLHDNPASNRYLLVNDITKGLQYLHSWGIVHGDLKGPNVMVDDCGRARLTDFGISSIFDSALPHWTSLSTVASKGGSTRWQAPELLDSNDDNDVHNTIMSDVYAWGCTCYEVFTGKLPFHEIAREFTVMLRVTQNGLQPSKPPADDSPWTQGLTDEFWNLMERCWAKDPGDRPSIEDLHSHPALFSVRDHRPLQELSLQYRTIDRPQMNPPTVEELERLLS